MIQKLLVMMFALSVPTFCVSASAVVPEASEGIVAGAVNSVKNPTMENLPFTLNPEPGSSVESLEFEMTIKDGYEELDVAEMMTYIYKDGEEVCGVYADPSDDYCSVTIVPEMDITETGEYELVFMAGAIGCEGDAYYYNAEELRFSYTLTNSVGVSGITAGVLREGVYNILGIKVSDRMENLPAGLYIVNGRKVAVK